MIVTYVRSAAVEDQYQALWRCETLAGAIRRTGRHQAETIDLEAFLQHTPAAQTACSRAHLIVVHRYLSAPVIEAVMRWKACGKKVILDLDEVPSLVVPGRAPAGREMPGGEEYYAGLRLVDAITSPSARLIDDWEAPVPVFHVPDYLDLRRYLDIKPAREAAIRIGLGGGRVSYASLAESGLLGALVRVCQQRPAVRLMIFGADSSLTRYLDRIELQKEIQPWVPAAEWPYHLSKLDIGLAPIAGEGERRKSWQRLLEYMVLSIPWVASDQLPYRDLKPYGLFTPNNEAQWVQALLEVIDHLDSYRARAAKEAFVFALGQDVDDNIEKVLAQYRTVLS